MLVLITGKSGAGKDTIGDYLKSQYGFRGDSLAAPIKKIVEEVFVLPKETIYDRKLRESELPHPWTGLTVRSLLQLIGTELFRDRINKDIWVHSLLLRIKNETSSNWTITDVRFPNEKEVIEREYDGKVITIKVVRPGHNGETKGGIKHHESESYDLAADISVVNDGGFEDLYRKIDEIMEANGMLSFSKIRDLDAIKTASDFLAKNGI